MSSRLLAGSIARSLVIAFGIPACGSRAAEAPLAHQGAPGVRGVRAIDWQNRTYQLGELGAVTVQRGLGELAISDDHKAGELGAGDGTYQVARPLFGDLDGDGSEDAVISSVLATGGTGQFSGIEIYTVRGGQVVVLGEIPGGDRGDGGIRGVSLDGRAVIVERNVLAEGDGICCASAAQRERWLWKNGALVEDPAARRPLDHADRRVP